MFKFLGETKYISTPQNPSSDKIFLKLPEIKCKEALDLESENLCLIQVVPHISWAINDMFLNLPIYKTCLTICLRGIMRISLLPMS